MSSAVPGRESRGEQGQSGLSRGERCQGICLALIAGGIVV